MLTHRPVPPRESDPPAPQRRGRLFLHPASRWLGLSGVLYTVLSFCLAPGWPDSVGKEAFLSLTLAGLLWAYWRGYRALAQQPYGWWTFSIATACILLLAALVPAFHSTDITGYINRGWQQVAYGVNPYLHPVEDIPGWWRDGMFSRHWVNNPSPYGFLFLQIARWLCGLGHGDFGLTVALFKGFNLGIHAGTTTLLGLWMHRRGKAPQGTMFLYGWNPLILLHGLANGHNDILMGFFVTLAACAGGVLLIPGLVAATLVKYGTVVLLPLAGLSLLKQKAWKSLGWGLLLGIGVLLACAWPYWSDWGRVPLERIQENALISRGSLHAALLALAKNGIRFLQPDLWPPVQGALSQGLKLLLLGGFGVGYLGLLLRRTRQPEYTGWIPDGLAVMALLICGISLKFFPWYIGMFFPLAFFLKEGHRLRRFVLVLTSFQLFAFTFLGQAHILNFVLLTLAPWLLVYGPFNPRRQQDEALPPTPELRSQP